MPEQGHYGADGRGAALVPGALTVYRHFYIDARKGWLTPIGYRPDRECAEGTARGPYPSDQPWEAACTPPLTFRFYGTDDELVCEPSPDHTAPSVDCTCGFYAHYDPSTDFYAALKWGRAYQDWVSTFSYGTTAFRDMILVRAVCEVSGTVVMGSLGVRAQKMTIKAMAVDWGKHYGEYLADQEALWSLRYDYGYGRGPMRMRQPYASPSEAEREWAAGVADEFADKLDIPVYDTAEEMYAAHPKSDISALGVEEKTEVQLELERHARWRESMEAVRKAEERILKSATFNQVSASFRQISAQMSGYATSISWSDEAYPDTSAKAGFEKTLEAKKNRPAPPGTGIDRRRGRLR